MLLNIWPTITGGSIKAVHQAQNNCSTLRTRQITPSTLKYAPHPSDARKEPIKNFGLSQ